MRKVHQAAPFTDLAVNMCPRFLPTGYKRLSAHYGWALGQVFDVLGLESPRNSYIHQRRARNLGLNNLQVPQVPSKHYEI